MFYTEFLTRKVDLHIFSLIALLLKKTANQLFSSQLQYRKQFYPRKIIPHFVQYFSISRTTHCGRIFNLSLAHTKKEMRLGTFSHAAISVRGIKLLWIKKNGALFFFKCKLPIRSKGQPTQNILECLYNTFSWFLIDISI